ncbi:U-box domain-containing protein 18 [Cajanus cajan]|uniref:RING-type E3 ubiquitin transferase n=1 Tax=Cajanus cajan TaxID=3821 RepID=A0A151SN86_CAJCA|nr:U-box domain-containing protein 18 [Cajanus cajan]KYP56296.1 U-box domain-containing protein 19 [Cajanus cajan]
MTERDRRTLSFPAVHPCEAVSPPTLLASLITLSQSICNYQPHLFPTQRRNARETIRQINIVSIFLQEIQERALSIPHSTILSLSLSELHFTLQKIHFLMQDLTLQGARLLLLAKSQHVASLFRAFVRAMATSLDVLPLHNLHVCREVKELAELVTRQARKAGFEVDPSDARATKTLHTVISQFARGTEPDLTSMHQIINYLQIKTWTDCNTEIKFLEDEINLECRDREEREVPLLSSLVGFLTYCRGLIFETNNPQGRCSTELAITSLTLLTSLNPEDFRCPISLELMTDPVTVSTGQTYDRPSITKWLRAGNTTCPKTGEKLTTTELVPNTTLKRLIQQFCADNGIYLANNSNRNRNIVAGSPAAAHAVQFLAWTLTQRLAFGTEEQKHKAAHEIRVLARNSIFNRACLVEVGAVSPLLELLASAKDKSTQENAISALLKLSKDSNGPKSIITSGGISVIVSVLKNGVSLEARQVAAAVIFYLSSVKEYRKLIGENPEVIPALVELVKEGTTCGRKNAVVAIFGLLLLPRNHQRALSAGAVPALLDILASSDKEELVAESLAVLAALAENVDGARAILQGSALALITGMLRTATSRAGKEHCVSILLSLSVNVGAEVVAVLAKDPSLMPLLYSLLTEGTSHAAKKARFLIRVIQDFHETRTLGLKGSSVPQEPSLHVW